MTFLAVVALHAAWDGIGGLPGYLAIGAISVGWLLWRLHRTRVILPGDRIHAIG